MATPYERQAIASILSERPEILVSEDGRTVAYLRGIGMPYRVFVALLLRATMGGGGVGPAIRCDLSDELLFLWHTSSLPPGEVRAAAIRDPVAIIEAEVESYVASIRAEPDPKAALSAEIHRLEGDYADQLSEQAAIKSIA